MSKLLGTAPATPVPGPDLAYLKPGKHPVVPYTVGQTADAATAAGIHKRKVPALPTSSKPGPDDRGVLSRWEQQILAGIEDDPAATDPARPTR